MTEEAGSTSSEVRVVVVDQYGGLHRLVQEALEDTPYEACRVPPAGLTASGSRAEPPVVTIINLCLPTEDLTLVRNRAATGVDGSNPSHSLR